MTRGRSLFALTLLVLLAECFINANASSAQVLGDARLSPSERTVPYPLLRRGLDHEADRSDDVVAKLNDDLIAGRKSLTFDPQSGYLASVLKALGIMPESQSVVFSRTSLQKGFISPQTPRAIYFNDDVSIGFIRTAPLLEIAVTGNEGLVYYTIEQRDALRPRFERREEQCLNCHIAHSSLGVPGMLLRSVPTDVSGATMPWLGNDVSDHTTPFEERWAGWYVTGQAGRVRHKGNLRLADREAKVMPLNAPGSALASLTSEFDTNPYPADSSDVAALMVMNRQVRMTNLLVRAGIDARILEEQPDSAASASYRRDLLESDARAVVDYMLFVGEVEIVGEIKGSTAFATKFAALGPFDKKGRSLRHLQLKARLLKYPCSYMIYSKAFVNLPAAAKEAIYKRLWTVLSGGDANPRYARLAVADRRAIVEILRETKGDLPSYFQRD